MARPPTPLQPCLPQGFGFFRGWGFRRGGVQNGAAGCARTLQSCLRHGLSACLAASRWKCFMSHSSSTMPMLNTWVRARKHGQVRRQPLGLLGWLVSWLLG